LSKKLQLMCEMQNLQNILSTTTESFLEKEIIESIGKGHFNDEPAILIYYHIFNTLINSDDVHHFYTLQKLLDEHSELFQNSERRDLYQYLMNFCIKKINTGEIVWLKILFDIYKSLLSNNAIYMDGYLSPWDFKNIVVIGLRSGEEQWVKTFIEEKNSDIASSDRTNAYNFNLAYYYFFIGEYRKSISLISKIEFTDLYYQLDSRSILLKCYYEMGDVDGLIYFMPSFRMFLRRNKLISDYQRTIYSNLVKFTNRLLRADGNKRKLDELKKQVEDVKQVADLSWLKTKIDELLT
jgi:hypothetical protein